MHRESGIGTSSHTFHTGYPDYRVIGLTKNCIKCLTKHLAGKTIEAITLLLVWDVLTDQRQVGNIRWLFQRIELLFHLRVDYQVTPAHPLPVEFLQCPVDHPNRGDDREVVDERGRQVDDSAGEGSQRRPKVGRACHHQPIHELISSRKLDHVPGDQAPHAVGIDVDSDAVIGIEPALLLESQGELGTNLVDTRAETLIVPGEQMVVGKHLLAEELRQPLHHPASIGTEAMDKHRHTLAGLELFTLDLAVHHLSVLQFSPVKTNDGSKASRLLIEEELDGMSEATRGCHCGWWKVYHFESVGLLGGANQQVILAIEGHREEVCTLLVWSRGQFQAQGILRRDALP